MQPMMFNDAFASGPGSTSGGAAPSASFPNDGLSFYSAPPSAAVPGAQPGFGAPMGGDFGFGGGAELGSMGSMGSGSSSGGSSGSSSGSSPFDEEPPLLEELGINFGEIWSRTLAVSLPFRPLPAMGEDDAELAGPLLFCLLLGTCLLLTGKLHFGYIYGFGVVGCLLMYVILNLMGDEAISVDRTMSILGYALLPLVLLAGLAIFADLRGKVGLLLAAGVIAWCTVNATRLFEKALSMSEQRYLVAYPVTMLYACFALLTIF